MKPTPTPKTGIALETVIIFTGRMEALANFYRDAFDLGEFNLSPGHMGLQVGPVYLGFDQVEEPAAGNRISIWFTVDDIQEIFERVCMLGARVRYPPTPKPWGALLAAVYDIDGNMIGLSQRNP